MLGVVGVAPQGHVRGILEDHLGSGRLERRLFLGHTHERHSLLMVLKSHFS